MKKSEKSSYAGTKVDSSTNAQDSLVCQPIVKPNVGRSADRKFMKLNSHGKYCLDRFLGSISASDLLISQLDYLYNKDLIGYVLDFNDFNEREPLAGHCLTDLGIETAKHYFPNYKHW